MRVIAFVLGADFLLGATHMDALPIDPANFDYSGNHPVLIAATTTIAAARARKSILDAGYRIGAELSIDEAADRIALQTAAAVVWVELDEDSGEVMDELLGHIAEDVKGERYRAIISTTLEQIDTVMARIGDAPVEVLVAPDLADRASALAVASSRIPFGILDVGSDKSSDRLRQLSEEVSRIASTLARLSTGPAASAPATTERPTIDGIPTVSAEVVRNVIRARRLRARFFSSELFADPAWDMLLDLLQAEIAQLRVPVSSLCIAAAVPATTALRWLKTMVAQGLFVRRADPHDGRRVFVELAPQASEQLRHYFAEVGSAAVI